MTSDDVNDLIDCHSQPLTDEDLMEMTKSASEEEEGEQEQAEDEEVEQAGLSLERLATMCNIAKDLQEKTQDWDDMVRSVHFCNLIDGAMTIYRNIFTVKKKQRQQLPITMFLSRKKQPTPSVEATEEAEVGPMPSMEASEEAEDTPPDEAPHETAPSQEL